MGSKKRQSWAKEKAAFNESLSGAGLNNGMDDVFAREDARRNAAAEDRALALRVKACESKNRYRSRYDAEAAIESCALHGAKGLRCYKCKYCNGWHLTHKDYED